MKPISIAIFLAAFFLLRPYALQNNGMWYAGDDYHYFAVSSSLAFGQYPSYTHEFLPAPDKCPITSPGPGVLAAPFVFAFSFIDRLEGSSIVDHRTYDNVAGSWSQFGFIFSSVFYFCVACFLLYRACVSVAGPQASSWAVILMIICQGLPLFAFRRPIFSHTAEFFMQSLIVYCYLRNLASEGRFIDDPLKYMLVGAISAMLFLVRYNNILMALACMALLLGPRLVKQRGELFKAISCALLSFFLLVLIFKIWPETYNHFHAYGNPFIFVQTSAGPVDIIKRLIHVFIGQDWGLLFTAPFLLLGFGVLLAYEIPYRKQIIFLSFSLLVNFYTIVFFGSQGGWYGYRYLVASALPVFVLPLAVFIDQCLKQHGPRILWLLILSALPPLFSMWCFEGNADTLTLHLIPQFWGRIDWSNDVYQISVWKTLFHPGQALIALLKGGPYYVLYLLSLTKLIPPHFMFVLKLSSKYTVFYWSLLIKVLVVYAIPLTFIWLCDRISPDQITYQSRKAR